MTEITREVRTLRRSLGTLDRSLRRLASMLGQLNGRIERRRKPRTGTRRALSTKARASLKLRGQYMGYMGHLNRKEKAQVRKVKEAKGFRAAIAKARRLIS